MSGAMLIAPDICVKYRSGVVYNTVTARGEPLKQKKRTMDGGNEHV